jgi:hypothetical protein
MRIRGFCGESRAEPSDLVPILTGEVPAPPASW